jgi:hypothetical protein
MRESKEKDGGAIDPPLLDGAPLRSELPFPPAEYRYSTRQALAGG